jgi:hypothetical protein
MLRSAVAAYARRHLSAASSPGVHTSIASLVSARGLDSPELLALVVPDANVRWQGCTHSRVSGWLHGGISINWCFGCRSRGQIGCYMDHPGCHQLNRLVF